MRTSPSSNRSTYVHHRILLPMPPMKSEEFWSVRSSRVSLEAKFLSRSGTCQGIKRKSETPNMKSSQGFCFAFSRRRSAMSGVPWSAIIEQIKGVVFSYSIRTHRNRMATHTNTRVSAVVRFIVYNQLSPNQFVRWKVMPLLSTAIMPFPDPTSKVRRSLSSLEGRAPLTPYPAVLSGGAIRYDNLTA